MNRVTVIVLLSICVAVAGCAGMSDTQQRTLSGAAIGAAAGAAGGYIHDKNVKSKEDSYRKGYEAGQQGK